MSKQQTRRKITSDSSLKQVHSNPIKDTHRRPSVFERLGTKAFTSSSPTNSVKPIDVFCRQWEQNGTCQYGKNCKYVSTHALISPSKRAAIKDANSKIINKSGSSSSSSGSSSTGSDSTSTDDSSSSGSSESVESSRHHRRKGKHMNSKKLKRHSSSSDKEHVKRNNFRTAKGNSPSKKGSHSASAVNVGSLHREMKHPKKRRSRDRSDGHISPRKGPPGSKKSLSPPVRSNLNSHKRRSQSPMLKTGKLPLSTSKPGINSRNIAAQRNARSPSSVKDKHNRSVSPRSRERDRERNREKEEKEREREREMEREKEREKEKERDREGKKVREREKDRELEKQRDKEREREKDRNRSRSPKMKPKDGMSRSPRKESYPVKELKRKESPDLHHGKAARGSASSLKTRDDNGGAAKHKVSPGENWHRDNRKDDKEEDRKRPDERRHKDDSRKEPRLLMGHEDKEHGRERDRERERDIRDVGRERLHERDREKDKSKSLLQQGIPSLLTLNLQHHPNDFSAHHSSGGKDRGVERNRSLERTGLLRNLSIDRGRERSLDRMSERSRGSERDRRCRNNNGGLEKGLDHSGLEKELAKALARNREQDRTFERGLDRGLDRNPDRVLDRIDRGLDRGLERGHDRGPERGLDRGLERGLDRTLKNDRGLDRASPRVMDRDSDRGLDRGLDRDPILGRLERGLERGLERNLDRGSPRLDREHRFPDRSPVDRLYGAPHIDHSRESDDKSYDSTYEGRRDRGRFSEQNRYDKSAPPNDDRRIISGEIGGFNDDRRRGRDGRQENRGGQWDARNERKRDHNHEREHGRDREHGPRGYDGGQRQSGSNNTSKRNDWEWDGRGRRSGKDWEGPHRSDNAPIDKEWNRFASGQGEWNGPPADRRMGGWNDEWRPPNNQGGAPGPLSLNRPPGRMLPLRDDSQNTSHKSDEPPVDEGMRLKDQNVSGNDLKVEGATECEANQSSNLKRVRDVNEGDETSLCGDNKRPFLEKDAALEEVLSDISDDADEILNREDSESLQATQTMTPSKENHLVNQHSTLLSQPNQPASGSHTHHRRGDGSGEGLGFEEISDGELEEEARANRGISDALGVDWASLVAETRPRVKIERVGSTRQRWEGIRLLTYIGISKEYAGSKLVEYILNSAFNSSDSDVAQKDSDCAKTDNEEKSKEKIAASSVTNSGATFQNQNTVKDSHSEKNTENDVLQNDEIKDERDNCKEEDSGPVETVELKVSEEVSADLSEGKADLDVSLQSRSKSETILESNGKVIPKSNSVSNPESKASFTIKVGGEESKTVSEAQGEGITSDLNQAKEPLEKLLHPVAGIHAALLERRCRRQALFSSCGPYKQALSARRDLSIRRQLCGLPPRETTCDNGPAIDELFRLSLQLLERTS